MNGFSSSYLPQPATNGDLHKETKQQVKLEPSHSTANKNPMFENRTDDEKTESLQMAAKIGSLANHPTDNEQENSLRNSGELTTKEALQISSNTSVPVEETIQVARATTAESTAASKMDGLLLDLGEDKGLSGNQTR